MPTREVFVNKYLEEIKKYPVFDRDQELGLAARIQNGDELALKHLVEANLRFVVLISKKYTKSGMPLSDLINEGTIGMIEAARRFKPDKGVKFISYAVWWIRQSIIHAIANVARIVRLPPKQVQALHSILKTNQNLMQKFGREPTVLELSSELRIPVEDVEHLLLINRTLLPIDFSTSENPEYEDNLVLNIPDQSNLLADDQIIDDACVDDVGELLKSLNEKEKEILQLHYGFRGTSMSLREIGKKYDLSCERIRQIERRALSKLRKLAVKSKLQDYLS
jgi:RNA polymerase primary sigma factor